MPYGALAYPPADDDEARAAGLGKAQKRVPQRRGQQHVGVEDGLKTHWRRSLWAAADAADQR